MTLRVLALDHVGVLGGAELSLLDIASAFGDEMSVRLFVDGPFRDALANRGVDVQVLPMGALASVRKESRTPSLAALAAAWRLAEVVANEAASADVLYANSQKAFVVAALAGRRARRPVVWHLRDLLGAPHFSALNTRGAVMLANWLATRVIANSHATADAFVRAGGRRALVRVVHNGVDPAPFDAVSGVAPRALRHSLSPDAAYVMAVFGRLHEWKGQQVAIDALAQLPPECALWVVGAPLFGELAFETALREQAARLGLTARVRFLGFRNDIAPLMRAADVIVHTSTWPEPFGRVIVEGMLACRPVVAASAGGVGEIVTHEETGVLVAPGDAAALAQAVTALRASPARAARLAEAGAAHARRTFGVPAMVDGVRRVLDEVLA